MKPNRFSYFAANLTRFSPNFTVLSVAALSLFGSYSAQATSATWTGTTSGTWGTSANWSGSPATVPGTGDTATFSGSGGATTIVTADRTIAVILFSTSGAAAYTLGATVGVSTVTLNDSGAITVDSSVTTNQLFNVDIQLGNTAAGSSYSFTNNSTTNGQLLTIAGDVLSNQANATRAKTLTLGGSGNGLISGVISGNGTGGGSNQTATVSLSKTGTGKWTLSGANTYSGTTTIGGGILSVATIGNGGLAGNLGAATTAAANLVFDGGTLEYTGATGSTNRNFTINTGKVAGINVTTNTLTISGASTSTNGGLTKSGAGTLTLSGNNLHTGDTVIKQGTLKLDGAGTLASTKIIVGDTGSSGTFLDATTRTGGMVVGVGKTISGIGTIQASTTIQGTLSAGNSGAGILNNLGNIALQSGSTFDVDITGVALGTGYDQLNVTGSATLGGLLAVTTGSYTPGAGALFFILANDGSDAISGTFSNANFGNSTVFALGGQSWRISYAANAAGGTFTGGNDVALMAVPEPGAALLGGVGVILLLRRRRSA